MKRRISRFLDALLGPRCTACRQRVFPNDQARHVWLEHAGDPYVE